MYINYVKVRKAARERGRDRPQGGRIKQWERNNEERK
jgi:hypothetical protein